MIDFKRIFWYVVGLFICAIGVVISIKSNLGVTPISTLPYSLSLVLNLDLGTATVIFHLTLVAIQLLILRTKFKVKFLLQVPVGIVFGYLCDVVVYIFAFVPIQTDLFLRVIFMVVSLFISALGIFIFLKQDIMSLAGEGTIQAVAIKFNKRFSSIKIFFDSTMVIISFILTGLFLNKWFIAVNVGTIISAIFIGSIIGLFEKTYIKLTGKDPNLKNE